MHVQKRFHLPASEDKVTLGGVTICGEDIAGKIQDRLSQLVANVLAKYGHQAFESPKELACVHEAGHAIVATWLGETVTSVLVYECPVGWAGFCDWKGDPWRIDSGDKSRLLVLARHMYAGLAGERMWADNTEARRQGSSLDELIVSQLATAMAAGSDVAGYELWQSEVYWPVLKCLDRHRVAFGEIADHLIEHNRMKGRNLRNALVWVK